MLTCRQKSELKPTPTGKGDKARANGQFQQRFIEDFLTLCLDTPLSNRLIDLEQPLSVLDVSTKTTQISIELCRHPVTCRVTSVSASSKIVALAKRDVVRAGHSAAIQIEFADVQQLPFADDSFDAVISHDFIHRVPTPRTVVAELIRVLRPDGVVFIRDLIRPNSARAEASEFVDKLGIPASAVTQSSDGFWTLAWLKV